MWFADQGLLPLSLDADVMYLRAAQAVRCHGQGPPQWQAPDQSKHAWESHGSKEEYSSQQITRLFQIDFWEFQDATVMEGPPRKPSRAIATLQANGSH